MTATTTADRRDQARRMHDEGQSVDAIATALGVRISTVVTYLKTSGRRPGRAWEQVAARPDYSGRPGPIYCTCGAPTPHSRMVASRGQNLRTERVDGIPWGFCSLGCYEAGFDRLNGILGGNRP